MKYAHKAKLISMYELAHCRPIVVISLLVLIAFYCINVYDNGYSAEHRLANPAPCLFQFTGKHVEKSSGVFLILKKPNNSLAQYLCRAHENVNTFPFSALS